MIAAVNSPVLKFKMADQNKLISSDSLTQNIIDFDGICRFCLAETQEGISVHDKCLPEESEGLESESVYNFITKLRVIEVETIDNFPTKICENCYELIKLFYNFSQVCQKSESLLRECYENTLKETKMGLNFKDIRKSEIKNPVMKPDNFDDKFNQAVQCVIGNKKQLNSFSVSDQMFFENYRQKLKSMSGGIKEAQSKLTEYIHKSSQVILCENSNVAFRIAESPHVCSQCSLQFSNPRTLNFHYAATHGQRRFKIMFKFQCKNCIKSFSDLGKLKRHYQMSHKISESELTEDNFNKKMKQFVQVEKINFFCFHCVPYKEFQTQRHLVEHLEECHNMKQTKGGPVLFSCAHCTYATFVTRHSLNQHLLQVHKLKEDEITWNDVKCISVAQKSQMVSKSPKVFICMNSAVSSYRSQQKSKNNLQREMPPSLDVLDSIVDLPDSSQQEKGSDSTFLCNNSAQGVTSANDFVNSHENEGKLLEDRTAHGSTEAKDDTAWNCSECPASYSRKQSLYCHMREKHNHVRPGATKCPECSESFLTNRRLIQHGISVHQKYFAYFHHVFKKVLQPVKEQDREKDFECDVCGRKYIYKTSLRKHVLAAHLEKSPKDSVTCPNCGKTLSNKLNLKSHIEFVHEALFVSCPICKKKINFRTIGRHYKTHRANVDGVFPGSSFLCNLCGKVLKSKRSFEDHQKLHQNIRDEICDVCGNGFTTKKLLRLHKKTHEGVARKMFACDQCEKVFSGRHTLNRHLLTHSGKKNFICEICSKCFYTIQELNRHVRYHKKDYKFDCQLCDMRFLCKSRFRHHMMKHRNIRPHKCQFCDKMFIERTKMKLHMVAKHNVEVHNKKAVWKDPKTYVPLDDLL